MIVHSKKIIFIHIPKTGGSSISTILKPYGIVLSGTPNEKSIYYKHVKASYIQPLLGDIYNEYFKFSVVRNPFDWLVSNYEFNRGLHRPYLRESKFSNSNQVPEWAKNMQFNEWLKWWLELCSPSQNEFVTDSQKKIIVDKIIKFENLDCDFAELCKQLKIEIPNGSLPHLRKSSRGPVDNYFTQEMIDIVIEKFADDFALFEYPKELPNKRHRDEQYIII